MGLRQPGVSYDGAETFSDDVLKIEICGPKQQHLSVIDVPGIFRNTTVGLTTDADMEIVRNMVNNYMKNPRSVILAVISANVDIATQEILKMAEKCDEEGQRTLGVLTKPDLVDKGAEKGVVSLMEGKYLPRIFADKLPIVLTSNRQELQTQAWLVDGQESRPIRIGRSHVR